MDAKKIVAFIAAVLMCLTPLVAVANENVSADEGSKVTSATHIQFDNLTKEDIEDIFGVEIDKEDAGMSSTAKVLLSLLYPGLNTEGLAGVVPGTVEMSGVDIKFDYIRFVDYGKSTDSKIGITVTFDEFSMTVKTYKGMYMLASEAYNKAMAGGSVPSDYARAASATEIEKYKSDATDDLETLHDGLAILQGYVEAGSVTEDDLYSIGEVMFGAEYLVETYGSLKDFDGQPVMSKTVFDNYTTYSEALNEAINKDPFDSPAIIAALGPYVSELRNWMGTTEEAMDKTATMMGEGMVLYSKDLPTIYAENLYSAMMIQTIMGNGNYADGIRDALKGKTFDGSNLTINGSATIKFYVNSEFVAQLIDSKYIGDDVKQCLTSDKMECYAFTQTGINLQSIISTVKEEYPQPEPGPEYGTEPTEYKQYMLLLQLIAYMPLTEANAELDVDSTLGYKGKTYEFSTHAEAQIKSKLTFVYEDINSVFNKSKDADVKIQVDDIALKVDEKSSLKFNGVTYENKGFNADLGDKITKIVDGMKSIAHYSVEDVSTTIGGDPEYEYSSSFGVIVDPSQPYHHFADLEINYNTFLQLFQPIQTPNDAREDMDEETAAELIESHGGSCSHDSTVVLKSLKDTQHSFDKTSDSTIYLAAIIIVLAVLVLIGFAAMLIRAKRN